MKRLLNTLYVTTPECYLALEDSNVLVLREGNEIVRVPLLNLEGIVTFGYTGTSPALMGACAREGISLCFMTANGRFLARVSGETQGNVLLRRTQYRASDDLTHSCRIAKQMISGKIFNARWVLERTLRDHPLRVNEEALNRAVAQLKSALDAVGKCSDLEELRGVEGSAASVYFDVYDELILQQKDDFVFRTRNRRPPTDPVNALLSFVYSLLTNETAAALSAVGLDPYVGFLHRDRPGRVSLALDVMEELRSVMADRFVITLINRKEVTASGFTVRENGAVSMDDSTRKAVLNAWHSRKQETMTHPFLNTKIAWGLVPHAQALLLARYMRGDLEDYPPLLWK